jgi:subtilase family serine protease
MFIFRPAIALIGAAAATAGVMIGTGVPVGASPGPAAAALAGSAAPFTARATVTGEVAGTARLTVQVWLAPRVAAAQRFAAAVSTPGGPLFRHYLSPDGYTTRFGPGPRAAAAVASWLHSAGFTAIGADPQRSYVRATASVARIDAAFGTRLRYYRASASASAGPYRLRANDSPVKVPAALAGDVLGVTGLDNAAPILPLARPMTAAGGAKCSHYYGQHLVSGLPAFLGTTTFPADVCGYSARQLRGVYHVSGTNRGAGQTIALTELGLTRQMFTTLRDYAKANGMPAPARTRYTQVPLGSSKCGDPFDEEEQLDVEASYDVAPGAHQLVLGGNACDQGDFGLQGLFGAITRILDGTGGKPLATVVSNSWGTGFEAQPTALTNIAHAFLLRAAAEGVGMYFSSGDISGPQAPANDPFAIAVGGTSLGIGRNGQRLFETGWSSGESIIFHGRWHLHVENSAAGGGPSLIWRQPFYQRGVVPKALSTAPGNRGGGPVRSVPDISADADPFTGFALGLLSFPKHGPPTFSESSIGGTSLAAPLVAGMVADAQQGQREPFGFTDPALYKLAGTAALTDPKPLTSHSPRHWRVLVCPVSLCGQTLLIRSDDQSLSMVGYAGQVTLPGYDSMTGVGVPDWPRFIAALRAVG